MKSLTFAISKGGVGKSLLTANVGAALSQMDQKVVLIEGDPNRPLQLIFDVKLSPAAVKLEDVVKRDAKIDEAIYPTILSNLSLIPSGISLETYFHINPVRFARKLMDIEADFLLVDVPFPLGEAAFLSLGVCQYFIATLTQDEFTLCVESVIDTIRFGKHHLRCLPLGFVLNRIKFPQRFTGEMIKDLEDLFGIPCIAKISEDPVVASSYGGEKQAHAFLAYSSFPGSDFSQGIDKIATWLAKELPKPLKKNVASFIQSITRPIKV